MTARSCREGINETVPHSRPEISFTRSDLHRPFVAPAAGWLAGLWVIVAAVLIADAIVETPEIAGLNPLISLAGVPAFALWRRWKASVPPGPT